MIIQVEKYRNWWTINVQQKLSLSGEDLQSTFINCEVALGRTVTTFLDTIHETFQGSVFIQAVNSPPELWSVMDALYIPTVAGSSFFNCIHCSNTEHVYHKLNNNKHAPTQTIIGLRNCHDDRACTGSLFRWDWINLTAVHNIFQNYSTILVHNKPNEGHCLWSLGHGLRAPL